VVTWRGGVAWWRGVVAWLVFYENVSALHTSKFRALYGQTVKMMNEKRLKDQRSYYVNYCHSAPS
jgi:hypothetical protein